MIDERPRCELRLVKDKAELLLVATPLNGLCAGCAA